MTPSAIALVVLSALAAGAGAFASAEAGTGLPTASEDDVKGLARANDAFALDLYAQLRGREGNLFFSPGSLSAAFAMAYAGARGETADQMARVLHFPRDPDRLHPAFSALLRTWNGDGAKRRFELSMANVLWGQAGFPFLNSYLKTVRDHYGAGLKEVDFASSPEEARRVINAWVGQQTRDKIEDLIRPGVLTPTTRLVLTNAVYFKGTWESPFKAGQTQEAPFHVSADRQVKVPMMFQSGHFAYHDAGTYQVLQMPYAGNALAMVVLLPKEVDGLAKLEGSLAAESLEETLKKLQGEGVLVWLPRFKTTGEFELSRTLARMGMPRAFGPDADFSGMDGKTDLLIQAAVHKAYVDVNEEGTEAAAATGLAVGLTSAAPRPKPSFRADHPFLFLIRDARTGSILFLGRVVNPQG